MIISLEWKKSYFMANFDDELDNSGIQSLLVDQISVILDKEYFLDTRTEKKQLQVWNSTGKEAE